MGKIAYQWHGLRADQKWADPLLVASSDQSNRADQGNHIKANEYLDKPEILQAKVKLLAQMVRQAKVCCAYTGAGLSRSSGIPDYATKAQNSVAGGAPKLKSNLDALPTLAHCTLTAMERKGFLHHYVQQNHDGLPQKSGFPQWKINEIHGAWYDPSNPVVQFSGSLRGDLFNWMIEMEKKIDLCLCLGTSLSGMNADRVAETPARKSLKDPAILGTVIINLQQTRLDEVCSLRIWAKLDDVFILLAKELELGEIKSYFDFPAGDPRVFHVPYDENGKLNPDCRMTLDLRDNKEIYIPIKKACNYMAKGIVCGFKDNGFGYSIQLQEGEKFTRRLLGVWWIEAALKGKVDQLPIINVNPVVVRGRAQEQTTTATTTATTQAAQLPPPLPAPAPLITIVQSHQRVPAADSPDNQHRWGLSIDPQTSHMVEKVAWILHPTFHPRVVSCTEAPFNITRIGWGTFQVDADITLKPEFGARTLRAAHELTFNGGGPNVKTTSIPVN